MDKRTPLVGEKRLAQGLTLVTYNRRTFPPLLKTWAEEGRTHGGLNDTPGEPPRCAKNPQTRAGATQLPVSFRPGRRLESGAAA